jgi:hypothetical protein
LFITGDIVYKFFIEFVVRFGSYEDGKNVIAEKGIDGTDQTVTVENLFFCGTVCEKNGGLCSCVHHKSSF